MKRKWLGWAETGCQHLIPHIQPPLAHTFDLAFSPALMKSAQLLPVDLCWEKTHSHSFLSTAHTPAPILKPFCVWSPCLVTNQFDSEARSQCFVYIKRISESEREKEKWRHVAQNVLPPRFPSSCPNSHEIFVSINISFLAIAWEKTHVYIFKKSNATFLNISVENFSYLPNTRVGSESSANKIVSSTFWENHHRLVEHKATMLVIGGEKQCGKPSVWKHWLTVFMQALYMFYLDFKKVLGSFSFV